MPKKKNSWNDLVTIWKELAEKKEFMLPFADIDTARLSFQETSSLYYRIIPAEDNRENYRNMVNNKNLCHENPEIITTWIQLTLETYKNIFVLDTY